MATRHGFFRDGNGERICRMGIWRIFDPFTLGPYARLSQKSGEKDLTVEKPQFIEFHFRYSVRRFLHSLEILQKQINRWSNFLAEGAISGPNPILVFDIPLEAGIAADSVFHYLNLINDDLAKAIPFVLSHRPHPSEEVESFSELKKKSLSSQTEIPSNLKDLFTELDREQSWWSLGFQRGQGIRQRLVHYNDLVIFQGKGRKEKDGIDPEISLVSVGEGVRFRDFEKILRDLLGEYCEWLDKLEEILVRIVSERMANQKVEWDWSRRELPEFALPVISIIANEAALDSEQENDLYLPVVVTQ